MVTSASAVVIDFDDLADGVVVTNQYPEATFSSETGYENKTTAQNLGTSLPNFICTAPIGGGIDCTHETIVDFPGPVDNLTFMMVGDNNAGLNSKVDVHHSAGTTTVDLTMADGVGTTPHLVDLTAFSSVTKIRIHSITDDAGLGWDDFTFDPKPVSVDAESWGTIKGRYR
jgi:hypothetical protein